ncbi:hypothetical protein [Flavilitoribacter nigricans]|uniref:Uncharacterized protein n=1 Tax=Flavilitoribacter nigricans (strain ATCC 23147 / DSM 23189 / NBRC 102662 / NCIMB 1420 / SS-2) TaxID=1122177 RepID=A0A2D0MYQ2_FLAN2|nr:hypothetical protein [Flavilitoribacter nigricans]PHN00583.1 hypothetical protein CRP01_41470 [Flavilitoribacter nigricans DSM 23189 = NBRC 102662]
MQEEITNKLIEIYAARKYNAVSDSKEHTKLCEEYGNKGWFNERRQIISATKKKIEQFESEKPSVQVSESLYLLNKRKDNDELGFDLAYKLIYETLIPNWNDRQIEYFEEVLTILDNCGNDYFLSFTSRKVNPVELNIVHLNYQHFIKYVLMPRDWKRELADAEQKNINLLARAINRLLCEKLKGFYYPSHEGDNTMVEKKLEENCCASFAFIQLIQNVIFNSRPDKCNYCHLEYKYAIQTIAPELRLYILAERSHDELVKKQFVEEEYEDWHQEVLKKDKIHLPFTESFSIKQLKEMRFQIEENLSNKIQDRKDKLFQSVPA